MESIIEYILANYTWIIGVAIIILLAIIGSYADKTNFGQGKLPTENELDNEKIDAALKNKRINDNDANKDKTKNKKNDDANIKEDKETEKDKTSGDKDSDNSNVGKKKKASNNESIKQKSNDVANEKDNKKANVQEVESDSYDDEFDTNYEKLNKAFDEVVPKKDIIDDDILGDLEDITFDESKKNTLNDMPSISDLELPKIKNLKSDDEDIWKF